MKIIVQHFIAKGLSCVSTFKIVFSSIVNVGIYKVQVVFILLKLVLVM